MPVDDLQFYYPDCTVCDDGGEMTYDMGYYCMKCLTVWDEDGKGGLLDDGFDYRA